MGRWNEDVFEGVVEIVAAAMEESEVELSAKGGERVADFFTAVYDRLLALSEDEDEEDEDDEDDEEDEEEEDEDDEDEDDEDEDDEKDKSGRRGAFEIYEDARGEYRFRLKAANGEVIAVSEGYAKKAACLKGVESVRKNAPKAKIK